MHDCPENDGGAELALAAARANRLYLATQRCLVALARHPGPVADAFESVLAPFYREIAVVETAMWRQVAPHVDACEAAASTVARLLGADHPDIGAITADAAKVNTALTTLTSLQREVLLSQPLIALANNIALDCQTEFDNGTALERWRAQLERVRSDVAAPAPASSSMADSAGKGEDGLIAG